jgi:hypothetical protein
MRRPNRWAAELEAVGRLVVSPVVWVGRNPYSRSLPEGYATGLAVRDCLPHNMESSRPNEEMQ